MGENEDYVACKIISIGVPEFWILKRALQRL